MTASNSPIDQTDVAIDAATKARVTKTTPEIRPDQVIVTGAQARVMLDGISISSLRRRMKEGLLTPISQNRNAKSGRSGKLYFLERDLRDYINAQVAYSDRSKNGDQSENSV